MAFPMYIIELYDNNYVAESSLHALKHLPVILGQCPGQQDSQ